MDSLNILLVSTQDYIHHPVPSRHHYIFEELSTRHTIHVPHFHVSRGKERRTNLHVHNATMFPVRNPALHYIMNGPFHFATMNKIIAENDIDIVVASHILAGTAAITAAEKAGIPVIFDLKDWFPESAAEYYRIKPVRDIIKRSVMAMTKYNLNHSDWIITVSPSLQKMLNTIGDYPSTLITNGVDTGIFRPLNKAHAKERLGIDKNTFVIGFVGSIESWFGIDELVNVTADLINHGKMIKLLVVGGGLFTDYYQRITGLVDRLRIKEAVKFTGIIEYSRLPEYIAAMDVCTIPFAKWGEFALPNKFFEYSACGRPVLMTPIPDVIAIGGENLFIYHTREEMINHLKTLMETAPTYSLDLEGYSWKSRSKAFERVFQSVMVENPRYS